MVDINGSLWYKIPSYALITPDYTKLCIQDGDSALVYSLLGLMVAHLQCGIIVNEWGFEFIDSDPVDAALFTVKLDPVQVDHCRENGELDITLRDAKEGKKLVKTDHSGHLSLK